MKRKLISMIMVLALTISLIPVSPATIVKAVETINIGDYVLMGKYFAEPILWRCVDIDENGPLMLSDRILTIKPFDARGTHTYLDGTPQPDPYGERTLRGSNLWQTSNMRSWLNSTATAGNVAWPDGCPPAIDKVYNGENDYAYEKGFLSDDNFSVGERNVMKSVDQKSLLDPVDATILSVGGNEGHISDSSIFSVLQNYNTAYYHNVTDKMFLLDVKQANRVYLTSSTLGSNYYRGKPTQRALDTSEVEDYYLSTTLNCDYWLRSPSAGYVRYVDREGLVFGNEAWRGNVGVRPAFYLDLQSAIFKSGNGLVDSPYSFEDSISTPIPVSSVKLNKTVFSMRVLQVLQLSATVSPTNASNKTGKWSSSNTKIAVVSQTGKVTAKGVGFVIITVTTVDGNKKATCKVTVIQPVKSVKLNKITLSILKGKTFKLISTINPSNASNKKVTWKSSNKAIATVSSTGTVKGIKKGIAYITVVTVDGKKSAKCKVVVK